ncbi:MAG: LuxR family transcriptional regulator [Amycolatopsis sp.]|uniref:helix-turn-helix transcriptional regulator n=1 Tax=Amycolatopsis sp. TaxID=37632 RepID=UPI002629FACC|nr:response regulator transcription factor [Amycolatopsis sp.]MCU1686076.1 LuxR family transcriptional regulator [Amycolatopsis sp.]
MEVVEVAVRASDQVTGLGAVSMLSGSPQLSVVDSAEYAQAKVIVIVEEFAGDDVFTFLREVRAASDTPSQPRCVLVTDHFRAGDLMTAIECGVAAVLLRSETGDAELVSTVLAVSHGAAFLPPTLQGLLLAQLDRMRRDVLEPHGLTLSGLAARERDVLRLVAEGFGTEEIAVKLAYSERTVKNVLHTLMTRYGLNTRAHAVAYALRAGVI